ncbi:MAG: hypothetical protein A4E28_01294 [Methanocella sp. PtaU1.Bin125]|nr:MAG: hypothetical protein A4E28_01294 [Methanocella sp. PtaU1.Bin125]
MLQSVRSMLQSVRSMLQGAENTVHLWFISPGISIVVPDRSWSIQGGGRAASRAHE